MCRTPFCTKSHAKVEHNRRWFHTGDGTFYCLYYRMVLSVPNGRTIAKKSDKRKALGRRHVSAISDFSQPFSRSERADIKKVELFSPFYPSFYPAFIVFFLEKVFCENVLLRKNAVRARSSAKQSKHPFARDLHWIGWCGVRTNSVRKRVNVSFIYYYIAKHVIRN